MLRNQEEESLMTWKAGHDEKAEKAVFKNSIRRELIFR